ncbi:hypothetical protein [Dinghuibacter silviterrae]|uniref:Uncharacterized protein n=1 Tax=Dinghuibacter silviterrae TaxID=1539049 RepID=A0A4R8DGI7_9BACT|nr:hypothetical protein [Dinghuibacter silviterrae]TDW96763.1 hypothetical protein EDB95_4599 [Dinghuibacter silviterrae]
MLSKKEVRHQIAAKLETALADFKPGMSEKKFKSRIKKASKLFSDAAPKTASTAKPKKAVKKQAPRKKAAEPVKP